MAIGAYYFESTKHGIWKNAKLNLEKKFLYYFKTFLFNFTSAFKGWCQPRTLESGFQLTSALNNVMKTLTTHYTCHMRIAFNFFLLKYSFKNFFIPNILALRGHCHLVALVEISIHEYN